MTDVHLLGPNGEDAIRSRSWIKEQLTLPNLVIACSIAFGVGGYIKAFDALEVRVDRVEQAMKSQSDTTAATYTRGAVQDAILDAINQRLRNIEADLKDLKAR